jgi:superfamily I DNA/RNA helicase
MTDYQSTHQQQSQSLFNALPIAEMRDALKNQPYITATDRASFEQLINTAAVIQTRNPNTPLDSDTRELLYNALSQEPGVSKLSDKELLGLFTKKVLALHTYFQQSNDTSAPALTVFEPSRNVLSSYVFLDEYDFRNRENFHLTHVESLPLSIPETAESKRLSTLLQELLDELGSAISNAERAEKKEKNDPALHVTGSFSEFTDKLPNRLDDILAKLSNLNLPVGLIPILGEHLPDIRYNLELLDPTSSELLKHTARVLGLMQAEL